MVIPWKCTLIKYFSDCSQLLSTAWLRCLNVFVQFVHPVLKSLVFLPTVLRFLQTEHNKECCVQMQEWRKLWNGHVHAQEMPRVSAEKVQGDGHAGWMWVLPADRRLWSAGTTVDQYDGEQKDCQHIFLLSTCTHCAACLVESGESVTGFCGEPSFSILTRLVEFSWVIECHNKTVQLLLQLQD